METRAASVIVCRPNTAPMRLDDGAADGQPHAAALSFGGKEGIEYSVGFARRQPHSGIAYGNLHSAVLSWLRLNREDPARGIHRLDAVEHQVHQDLLELNPIGVDLRQALSRLRAYGNGMPGGLSQ